jgi:Transglycosylase-like domain
VRTRIALVAITSVALITVSILEQAATAPSAHAGVTSSSPAKSSPLQVMPPKVVAHPVLQSDAPLLTGSSLLLGLPTTLASLPFTGTAAPAVAPIAAAAPAPAPAPTPAAAPAPVAAAPPAPPATPADTVTPVQREEWERVAMCEEGGDWTSDGGRFSGGLGITRTNWDAYGGKAYAPEGAMATEDQQIMVAERIESSPPDQYGCHGW